jgi:mannose-6-phosphate isomerase class I
LPQDDVDQILGALIERLTRENEKRPFSREDQEFWILRSDREFSRSGKRDRGLFSIYLLNLVHLKPGEGLYLSAGVLHAYLEGSGIEIMANSNNVLRGGLTPKHVDVTELLANVTFECGPAEILRPTQNRPRQEWTYSTPATEFELRRIEVSASHPYQSATNHEVEILIVTHSRKGTRAEIETSGKSTSLKRGHVCLIPHGTTYTIRANQPITLYKATVP